jgi:hypothetical protein
MPHGCKRRIGLGGILRPPLRQICAATAALAAKRLNGCLDQINGAKPRGQIIADPCGHCGLAIGFGNQKNRARADFGLMRINQAGQIFASNTCNHLPKKGDAADIFGSNLFGPRTTTRKRKLLAQLVAFILKRAALLHQRLDTGQNIRALRLEHPAKLTQNAVLLR